MDPIAIGVNAGTVNQSALSIAVGQGAANTNQAGGSISIGFLAGNQGQSTNAIALGTEAGETFQLANAIAIGNNAGSNNQGGESIAIGRVAGQTNQGALSVSVGWLSGNFGQSTTCVAIGHQAGQSYQGQNAIGIGLQAGRTGQGTDGVAIGRASGSTTQGSQSVAVGSLAGQLSQSTVAVAIGRETAQFNQNQGAVALGWRAGNTGQGNRATAIGPETGYWTQGLQAVALGFRAGFTGQQSYAVALGADSGGMGQATQSLSVGYRAGNSGQQSFAVALGTEAGFIDQRSFAVAIGYRAGRTSQVANSIVMNARGTALEAGNTGFFVSPIRYTTDPQTMNLVYNNTTSEVIYTDNIRAAGSASELQYNNAGNVAGTPNMTYTVSSNVFTFGGGQTGGAMNVIAGLAQGVTGFPHDANGNAVLAYRTDGRYVEVGADTANTSYLDFHSNDNAGADYDTRIVSTGGVTGTAGQGTLTCTGKNYVFRGYPNGNTLGSTGQVELYSYVNYMALEERNNINYREYTTSRRVYNGRMNNGGTSFTLTFYSDGTYPLYGIYTQYFMNKAGAFANNVYMVMRGAPGNTGNTSSVTWSTLSTSTGAPGLSVAPENASTSNIPQLKFDNNSNAVAFFMVIVDAFNDSSVFDNVPNT